MRHMIIALSFALLSIGFLLIYKSSPNNTPTPTSFVSDFRPFQTNSKMKDSNLYNPTQEQKTQQLDVPNNNPSLILNNFSKRFNKLLSCFNHQVCNYSQKDPRSYEMESSNDILNELKSLRTWVHQTQIKDRKISAIAVTFLNLEWSEIKVECLKLIATQTPDERVRAAILKHVIHHPQPDAIPLAIEQLSRFKDTQQQQAIEHEIRNVLIQGSLFSALEIAKNITPLVHRENKRRYLHLVEDLKRVPLSQEIALNLEQSLQRNE